MLVLGADEASRAPGLKQAAVGVGKHHQVAGIAQQVRVLRQHGIAGVLQQCLAPLQEGAEFGLGQAIEVGGALWLQAVIAAARPGGLDQLGMGRSGGGHGPVLCDCCYQPTAVECRPPLFIVKPATVQVFSESVQL
ncbi:hypothetical protein D3C81_1534170 [compost metagenome]